MRARVGSRRGMTLMEVMVSVAILLVMGLIIAESMGNAIEYQRLLEDRDVTIRQARVAMSKLRREIEQAYLTPSQQAIERVQTVFVGMDDEPDTLFFATMAHQRVYRDSRECDQAEITIWAERATEEQGRGHVLYHRESPRVDEVPDEQGQVYPLAYNVRSFNLRYLDPRNGGEWKEEWDSRSTDSLYRLPRAVEIGLVLIAPDPDDPDRTIDVPFVSTVSLFYGGRLKNEGNPMANLGGQPLFGGNGNPEIPSPLVGLGMRGFTGFGSNQIAGTRPAAGGGRSSAGSRSGRSGSSRGGRRTGPAIQARPR